MEMPREHWITLHSTQSLERLNRELKGRNRVVSIPPNLSPLSRLVGALLLEEQGEWMVGRRYISERPMKLLKTPAEELEELVPGAGCCLKPPRAQGPRGPWASHPQQRGPDAPDRSWPPPF